MGLFIFVSIYLRYVCQHPHTNRSSIAPYILLSKYVSQSDSNKRTAITVRHSNNRRLISIPLPTTSSLILPPTPNATIPSLPVPILPKLHNTTRHPPPPVPIASRRPHSPIPRTPTTFPISSSTHNKRHHHTIPPTTHSQTSAFPNRTTNFSTAFTNASTCLRRISMLKAMKPRCGM